MIRIRLLRSATLALMLMATPAFAKPATATAMDPAAAVADSTRSEANRKLDEGRMPAAVLAFADFRPGDTVADYQAGGGYYSELIADAVGPQGRVYALTQPNMYKPEAWAALTRTHPNVLPLVSPAAAMQLAPNSVDAVFAHLVYHDVYWESAKYQHPFMDPGSIAANWFAAVKPGGTVIVIDHAGPGGDTRAVVEKFHRIDPARVKADMTEAGFVFEAESAVLHRSDDPQTANVFDPSIRGKTDRFMLKFRKPH